METLKSIATNTAALQKIDTLIKQTLIQALKGHREKNKLEGLGEKTFSDSVDEANSKAKTQEIVVFSYYNRLSSIFPSFRLPFSSNTNYEARLSFCLPTAEPPVMIPAVSPDLLDDVTVIFI